MKTEKIITSSKKTKFVFKITPETWVRVVFADRIFFRIKRDQLRPDGLRRLQRIEKYNNYKINISAEAKRIGFTLPEIGAGITFFIPVPKSWSKKKKRLHHGQFHDKKPDLSNILKAFEDALLSEDKKIAYYTHLCKRWVNSETGWIEVTTCDPAKLYMEPPSLVGEIGLM